MNRETRAREMFLTASACEYTRSLPSVTSRNAGEKTSEGTRSARHYLLEKKLDFCQLQHNAVRWMSGNAIKAQKMPVVFSVFADQAAEMTRTWRTTQLTLHYVRRIFDCELQQSRFRCRCPASSDLSSRKAKDQSRRLNSSTLNFSAAQFYSTIQIRYPLTLTARTDSMKTDNKASDWRLDRAAWGKTIRLICFQTGFE